MGMFDYVDVEPQQYCRKCRAELHGWQSKDADCDMSIVHFSEVNNFYTSCGTCQEWHEFVRKPARKEIDDYELLPSED